MPHLIKIELRDDRGEVIGTAVITPTAAVGYRFNVERWADFRELMPAGADQLVEMLEDELATLAIGGNVDAQQHPELTHVLAEAFHHHRFTAKTVDVQQRDGAGWTTRVVRGRHYDPWLATGDSHANEGC